MLFNSHLFILVFLPLCLAGWYILNQFGLHRIARVFLLGMSLWFYGFFNVRYLILITASILINWVCSLLMARSHNKKPAFLTGIMINIAILGYFKYFDFFVENINSVFHTGFALKHLLLPLGISFFTLQQISFIIDRYKESTPHYPLLTYSTYVTFFPQLVAGPIVLHSELIPQLLDKQKLRFNFQSFRDGIALFILGLAKKVLIADFFALTVNYGFDMIRYLDSPSAWVVAPCYTFEIYFDFSGYSDMAVGLARMFNIDIPGNFDSPYKASDITQFWRRWHITLTRFLTKYIYIPLGGIRKCALRKAVNILVVFLISGLWHGASWTFVIWGLLHGLAMILHDRFFYRIKKKNVSGLLTFLFLIVTWAIFRSENIETMSMMLSAMFVPKYSGFLIDIGSTMSLVPLFQAALEKVLHIDYTLLYRIYTVILMCSFLLAGFILRRKNSTEIIEYERKIGYSLLFSLTLGILLAWCLVSMTGLSTFLYFNF